MTIFLIGDDKIKLLSKFITEWLLWSLDSNKHSVQHRFSIIRMLIFMHKIKPHVNIINCMNI